MIDKSLNQTALRLDYWDTDMNEHIVAIPMFACLSRANKEVTQR